MPRVEDVARMALAAVDTDANLDLCGQWVNDRIAEAAASSRFRFLRQISTVYLPAPISTGLATIAQDASVVTGDSDARAVWTTELIGRHFSGQTGTHWSKIVGVDGTPSLTLETPWTPDALSASSYRIVQRIVPLPDFRQVSAIICPRLRRTPFDIVTLERLNEIAPDRQYLATGPALMARHGEDETGNLTVELYPYSTRAETLIVYGYRRPKTLQLHEYLPGAIDAAILKEGVLCDIYRYEHAKAVRAGGSGVGGAAMLWQQQSIAQEARWKNARGLLAMQDRGLDDAMIDAQSSTREAGRYDRDVTTARDHVVALGRRP